MGRLRWCTGRWVIWGWRINECKGPHCEPIASSQYLVPSCQFSVVHGETASDFTFQERDVDYLLLSLLQIADSFVEKFSQFHCFPPYLPGNAGGPRLLVDSSKSVAACSQCGCLISECFSCGDEFFQNFFQGISIHFSISSAVRVARRGQDGDCLRNYFSNFYVTRLSDSFGLPGWG